MQPELKEKLEQAAREAGRSLNAEIIARLQASLLEHAKVSETEDTRPALRQLVIEELETFLTNEKLQQMLAANYAQAVKNAK